MKIKKKTFFTQDLCYMYSITCIHVCTAQLCYSWVDGSWEVKDLQLSLEVVRVTEASVTDVQRPLVLLPVRGKRVLAVVDSGGVLYRVDEEIVDWRGGEGSGRGEGRREGGGEREMFSTTISTNKIHNHKLMLGQQNTAPACTQSAATKSPKQGHTQTQVQFMVRNRKQDIILYPSLHCSPSYHR